MSLPPLSPKGPEESREGPDSPLAGKKSSTSLLGRIWGAISSLFSSRKPAGGETEPLLGRASESTGTPPSLLGRIWGAVSSLFSPKAAAVEGGELSERRPPVDSRSALSGAGERADESEVAEGSSSKPAGSLGKKIEEAKKHQRESQLAWQELNQAIFKLGFARAQTFRKQDHRLSEGDKLKVLSKKNKAVSDCEVKLSKCKKKAKEIKAILAYQKDMFNSVKKKGIENIQRGLEFEIQAINQILEKAERVLPESHGGGLAAFSPKSEDSARIDKLDLIEKDIEIYEKKVTETMKKITEGLLVDTLYFLGGESTRAGNAATALYPNKLQALNYEFFFDEIERAIKERIERYKKKFEDTQKTFEKSKDAALAFRDLVLDQKRLESECKAIERKLEEGSEKLEKVKGYLNRLDFLATSLEKTIKEMRDSRVGW